MECTKCGNQMQRRRIQRKTRGPYNRPMYRTVEYCEYCEWKGDTGAGKLLKEIIKANNGGNNG